MSNTFVDEDALQTYTNLATIKYREIFEEKGNKIVSPEDFGAKGDGITDDTQAFQAALDVGGTILLKSNKEYYIENTLFVKANTIINLNGSKITCAFRHLFYNFLRTDTFLGYNGNGNIIICDGDIVGGGMSFIHGENILISNVHFSDCINDHYLEICACKNFTVEKCTFSGMTSTSDTEYINIDECIRTNFPWLPVGSSTYDGTPVDGIYISNCLFNRNETYMDYAIGKHSYTSGQDRGKNIVIRNCKIYNATKSSFNFAGVENLLIESTVNKNDTDSRIFQIRFSDNIQLISNQSIDLNEHNNAQSCNNFYIINDITQVSKNAWGWWLSGSCDNVIYKNSIFINNYDDGSGNTYSPIRFYSSDAIDTSITNFSAVDNAVIKKSKNQTAFSIYTYAVDTWHNLSYTLSNIDYVLLTANAGSYEFTGYIDITQLNELNIIVNGQLVRIAASGTNFSVNDTYKVLILDSSNQPYAATITITSNYKISIDNTLIMGKIWGKIN